MSEADGKIDYAEVMRRLPHRYPFLLVDKAEDFVPATSITGVKNVTHNEPFFPGHFPIDPVMPGVLIVEAMAQTTRWGVEHRAKQVSHVADKLAGKASEVIKQFRR